MTNTLSQKKPGVTLRLCAPRGFCAGVDRAIQIVLLALKKYGPPVYVRHEIVHNAHVVEGLRERGAVFVEELDEIPQTDQPVIFSAHGVPQSVPDNAVSRNLFYLDATCPLVSKVHKQAMRHNRLGRHVLLIGHEGHPEVIGTMGQLPEGAVSLVETVEQAHSFPLDQFQDIGFVTQTTLSVDDTAEIIAILKDRRPDLVAPAAESICYATTNRQESVKAAATECDHFFVVGASNSSNSKRLVEVALQAGAKASSLVRNHEDIDFESIQAGAVIGLSAGASAPEILVNNIIDAFKERFAVHLDLVETAVEDELFPVMRDLRKVEITDHDMAFLYGQKAS
jgi:4-hydroxy-3-methylbut-2-enyl diphosphate reductase